MNPVRLIYTVRNGRATIIASGKCGLCGKSAVFFRNEGGVSGCSDCVGEPTALLIGKKPEKGPWATWAEDSL